MAPDRPRERARTDGPIALETAVTADLDRVEALLAANDLPTRDVRTGPGRFFLAREDSDGAVVGVGGIERHGTDGLLRSVVIEESSRGRGYGRALCGALAERARRDGVETLYLLTTTAAPFFARIGYEPVGRERVPARIRSTTEFSELCPESATCLRNRLD